MIDGLGFPANADRLAGWHLLTASVHHARRNNRSALVHWRLAANLARFAGNSLLELLADENRIRVLDARGERALAQLLSTRADELEGTAIGALPRARAASPERPPGQIETRRRLADEVVAGAERLDEVIYGVLSGDGPTDDLHDGEATLARSLRAVASEHLPVDPLGCSLLAIAGWSLEDEPDDMRRLAENRLIAWLAPQVDDRLNEVGADVLLHARLRRGLVRFGEERSSAAIGLIETCQWAQAYAELLAAAASYALIQDFERAGSTLLHASYALCQLDLPDAAHELVEWVAAAEIASLRRSVSASSLKVLAHRVTAGLANAPDATEEANRLVEAIGEQRDAELGAALLASAQIHYRVGEFEAATSVAEAAAQLLIHPDHVKAALELASSIRSNTT
jgi:tetratricopeptide (TPR) repeat protein